MSTPAEWSPDDFAARLKERSRDRRAAAHHLPVERLNYRRAAALLYSFDPRTLQTPTGEELGGAVLNLVEDCTSRAGNGVMLWRLRPDVRSAALASFASPAEALKFLEPNVDEQPDPSTARAARALLTGEPLDLEQLDVRSLNRLREATSWLRQVPGRLTLPQDAEIDRLLERSRLLEPLRALLRQPFEGRRDELAVLQDYIGLVPARTWRRKLARVSRTLTGGSGRADDDYPLVVHGPGGIGKSTLVAKSLLDHLTSGSVGRFPFVYVDAERATVWLNEPLSLVAEMARQLAVQYPAESAAFRRLSASARVHGREQRSRLEDLEDLKEVTTTKTIGRAASYHWHAEAREDEAAATKQLGRILRRATVGKAGPAADAPPFVAVLDSFEEAQYRSSPVLDRMWAMFTALRVEYPRTRVIVAGRAPVGHPNVDPSEIPTLPLGELDRAAAQDFLVERGVGEVLAGAIFDRIGGNPLSLSLAAKVVESSRQADVADSGGRGSKAGVAAADDDWIRDLPAKRRRLFGAVDDMLIQGFLYDRLLMHITNPDVRSLAHPGLVLRRITPEIIRVVLAPLCGVDASGEERPGQLFGEMARELDLVDRVAPDVLQHRSDVRRVMLRLLEADRTRPVRAVERAAVEYYAASHRPEDRAEELYHRLRLGDLRQAKARWMPEAAAHLAGVEAELPSRSAKRLLVRLMQGAPELELSEDEQLEWEQSTAEEVENLLTQGFTDDALALMEQRKPWSPCSPLHALLVEARLRQGRLGEARATVTAALEAADREQCGDAYLELLLLSAGVSAAAGDMASAEYDLEAAEQTATRLGRDLDALGALLTRAQLHEATKSDREVEAEDALIKRVDSLPDELLATRPALVRAVAAEVGVRAPRVLSRALSLVGLPVLSERTLDALAHGIVRALDEPAVAKVLAGLAAQDPDRFARPEPKQVEELLRSAGSTGELDEVAKHLLAIDDASGALREGIAAAMVEGQDDVGSQDDVEGRDE